MTSPVLEYVPTTFEELASSIGNGKFSCGTIKGSSIVTFLMNSKTENAKILADHITSNKDIDNAEESIARVLKGKFAFIDGSISLEKIRKSNGFGELSMSEDSLVTFPASYGIRKGFPYRKELDKILSRLFQSGITGKFENHGESVERQRTSEIRQLIIEDFLSPFALLFIGYILSFNCLVVELILAKRFRL